VTRLFFIVATAGVLSTLFLFGLLRGKPDRDIPSNLIGKHAPAFTLPLHESYWKHLGQSFSLAEHKGRPMVINFWASWCLPCYQEAPELAAAWRKYGSKALFVGIQTQDRGRDEEGQSFVNQFALGFPNVIDEQSALSIEYGLFGVPETFFVNSESLVTYRHIGPLTKTVLEDQIRELLR
jgi:cytochrome c biogenesis protein CcmG/thiol:disulfide interchange protein DsbE